ncbi:probable serine/threonine-protein kinase mps1 [Drosophila subpulchrella]|uniref:probable serine/threonine-protein kinase mps1 n=1 Tax=Drosophila subpulchrella TaxID=1486046 RepID=UPI0018A1973F|nr:probable serine/threonine-protein kinase mps1 [Drosophila subpulchrella]
MCLLATGATGESMIEVDENGDEYELKRFYIQGRQLRGDGSQSQCVVTRRKRSGRGIQSGSVAPGSVSVSSQPLRVEGLPAKEHREGGAVLQEVENSNRRFVALTGVHLESPVHQQDDRDAEENDDDDDDQEEDEVEEQSSKSQSNYVPAALALPLQSQTSAAHLNQGVSVVANAASHANVGEDAGIVVVQSHQPPKVNPDTHAVFELKPIQPDVDHHAPTTTTVLYQPWDEDDYDEDDYDEEDYDDFYYGGNGFYRDQPGFHGLGAFEEEIISEDQPISTMASWTTGEDDSDIRPVVNKRPNQMNKNKNQKIKNQKNQNQKNQNQKNKQQQQKKRKQEAQGEEQPAKRKQKKPQQDKGQKKKQDKDQKKKKPEENSDNQEMDQLTPVDVIKKPVAMESSSAVAASSSSTSTSGSNSSASNSTDQKKQKKKKQPSSNSSSSSSSSLSQRKTKKKKKQSSSSNISSSNSNRRRRPSSNMGSSSGSSGSSSSIGGYRRRRPQQQLQQQRRRKTQQQQKRRRQQQQQKRRRQQQQKRRRLQNKNRQFYGDEPIINCIYINKDPPTTTTPRPFWNILGRQSETDASSKSVNPVPESSAASSEESQVDPVAQQAVLQAVRRNFGDFGGRKRTNLRFVS